MSKKRKTGRCRRAVTRARPWKKRFLDELVKNGSLSLSGRLVGVGRETVLAHRKKFPEFDEQVRNALAEAGDLLEAEARRRGFDGVDEPVIHQGVPSGQWVNERGLPVSHLTPGAVFIPLTVKKYSDTLLMFMLRALKPKRFRENHKIDIEGKVKVRQSVDFTKLSTEQLKALADIAKTAVTTTGPGSDSSGTGTPQSA
jgi:hypothetical protein